MACTFPPGGVTVFECEELPPHPTKNSKATEAASDIASFMPVIFSDCLSSDAPGQHLWYVGLAGEPPHMPTRAHDESGLLDHQRPSPGVRVPLRLGGLPIGFEIVG